MSKLIEYRDELNVIDIEINKLLDRRFEISKKVGQYKKENNLSIENKLREQEIIDTLTSEFDNEMLIKEVYEYIFLLSKRVQK